MKQLTDGILYTDPEEANDRPVLAVVRGSERTLMIDGRNSPALSAISKQSRSWLYISLLVFAMLALGFWFNAIVRVRPMLSSNSNAELGLRRFRQYCNLMTISGVLVLLLTALAQAT